MGFQFGEEPPSYLYAADIHNVANGKPSVIDTAGDVFDAATKGSVSVIARAIASTINIVPAATNWAGITDIPELKTEDILSAFDDDLAAYYSEHRETIDVVGDVIGMFAPGMAGVKALNYAQVGLKGMSSGNAGKNILKSVGALPDNTQKFAKRAAEVMADKGTTFAVADSNILKSIGSAYAQNALEAAAFEVAASTAMGDRSPIFAEHTAMDIVYNSALGGGIIGGGLLGTVSAVQTYGAFKRAKDAVDRALMPLKKIDEVEASLPEFAKLLSYKNQLDNPPVTEGIAGVSESVAARTLEKRQRELSLSIQESATKIAGGDAEVGKLLASSLKDLPQDRAWQVMLHMDEAALGGVDTKLEAKLFSVEKAKNDLANPALVHTEKAKKNLETLAASGDNKAVKYLELRGERAGQVTTSAPLALGIADTYSQSELTGVIAKLVKGEGAAGVEWSPISKSIEQVEARYIVAASQKLENGAQIASADLPYLEAAFQQGLERVVVNGMELDKSQLLQHIKNTKENFALQLIEEATFDVTSSTTKIAKKLNLPETFIEGGAKNSDEAYFAVQSGTELKTPSMIKIAYTGDPKLTGVSGDVMSGMASIMQFRTEAEKVAEKAVTYVIGEEASAMIPKLADIDVLSATSRGAGAGLLSAAAGAYQHISSKVEWMGKMVNTMKTKGQKEINDTLQPVMYKVMQNNKASSELAAVRQTILSTGEKYVYANGEVVLKDVAAYEAKLMEGKKATKPPIPAGVTERFSVTQQETQSFLETWVSVNDAALGKEKMLRNAIGKDIGSFGGELYFPQPDTRKFPFFSMVVAKNPAEGQKAQMIWAHSAEELATLESKVPMEYSILRKADTDRYYKAMKEYDYELGFNSGQILEDLKRTGAASSFFVKTDPQQLMQEMLDWRHRISDRHVRDAVTLKNQVAFSELRRLDADYLSLQKSTKQIGNVDSAFGSYVSTALDIPRSSHVPIWTEFNNLAENLYTKAHNKIAGAWKGIKSPEEMAVVNSTLEEAGIRGYKDAYTELFANHPAGGRELSKFVMTANGVLSTLLLRADPMNAVNNGLGSLIITGAETSWLIKSLRGAGGEVERELLEKAFVTVPGSTKSALSPTKLISAAYQDWFKLVRKDPEMLVMEAKFDKGGFLPSMMDQIRSVMDNATLNGLEKAGELQAKTNGMMRATGELLEKVTGNKSVEEMNRFVSAHIADSLSGLAVKSGKMTEAEQFAFINTFVNRTQGNYLASQRPLMFQGPVGHAISLFQTYSFNMMQHVFRRVEVGDKKQLAVLLGLQTGLYGFNGLPAFDFMNKTLIGTAAGNTSGRDAYSFLADDGGEVGKWLLYGGLSNATGLGLYSRGDLNPRHMTILPNSVGDIPFISAAKNFLGAMVNMGSEMMAGGDIGSTFLRGLEHAQISRPLAGIATVMQGLGTEGEQGYTTTGKNQLFTAFDMFSLQSVGRIAGARPMDEAIARDTYHRVQVYDSHRQAQTATIGSAIRDKARSGQEISEGDMNDFLTKYVHAGGDQKNFIKFHQKNVKDASKSVTDSLTANAGKPYSQYMQAMTHGGEMSNLE